MLLKVFDKLATTVVALMILLAVVEVAVFLVLGGLTPWADVSDDHGLLLTSAGWVSILVNNSTEPSGQHYMDITTAAPAVELVKGNVEGDVLFKVPDTAMFEDTTWDFVAMDNANEINLMTTRPGTVITSDRYLDNAS